MFKPMPYLRIKKSLVLLMALALIFTVIVQQTQAYEVNKNAIVLLIAKDSTERTLGTGTGFIVKPEGVLVTNYHVLVDAASLEAVMKDGNRVQVETILKVDRTKDFALLKLAKGTYSTLEVGDSDRLKEFDYLSALGFLSQNVNPNQKNGRSIVLQTYGFVLGIHPQAYPEFSFIYTTASFGPGFSGGPVIDKENRVVGIATVEGRSINLALPINLIKPFLNTVEGISFARFLKEERHSKETHYYRGNHLLHIMGDPEGAAHEFKTVLKMDDSFVLAHYDLAAAYQNQGMTDQAIEEYEKTLVLNPMFPEGASNLGGYYFRVQKYEEAVDMFEQAIQAYPNFIQAVDMFEQAIQAYPNFIQAHSNLGAVLNKLGRSPEAENHLEKALSLDPKFGIAYFNLGNTHMALNHLDEAREAYDRSVENGIDFLSLHWNLYEIHHRQQKNQEAIKQLNIILQIDPLNLVAQKKLKELAR